MTSLAVQPRVSTAVETLVVPVPRTSAVVEVWAELAYALGVSQSHIENILKKGLYNYLLASATIVFVNKDGEIEQELEMKMDWKKHQLLLECEPNIDLCPQRPFSEQLHANFLKLVRYIRQSAAASQVAGIELWVRWRDEIYADPKKLAQAQAFLGVGPMPPRNYAHGQWQPDMTLRFAPIPESTFVLRENWPPNPPAPALLPPR
jgi:hypothetical protein